MIPLFVFVIICIVAAIFLVRRYDLYDKEPWFMLLLTGLFGAGVMWVLGYIEDITIDYCFGVGPSALELASVASTHEELGRLFIVLIIALFIRRYFNDPMDGLIYGSMAGLGMAASESFSHWDRSTLTQNYEIFGQEVTRLYFHTILGGIATFGLGPRHLKMKLWGWMLLGTFSLAILIHFVWDWISLTISFSDHRSTSLMLASIATLVFGTFTYGCLTVIASEWSRQHFAPHSVGFFLSWPLKLFKNSPP